MAFYNCLSSKMFTDDNSDSFAQNLKLCHLVHGTLQARHFRSDVHLHYPITVNLHVALIIYYDHTLQYLLFALGNVRVAVEKCLNVNFNQSTVGNARM